MNFNGGTISYKDTSVRTIDERSNKMRALLEEALADPLTRIDINKKQEKLMTVLYRITISKEIMTKYFSSIDQKTQQPSVPLVLFVKHLRDNDITTFNNETTIHMDITHKITDPISPSILHYETIKEDITKEDTTYTPLGTILINLLKTKDDVYNTIDTHFRRIQAEVLDTADKLGIISERVIIMEAIEGITVYDSKDPVPDTFQLDVFYLLIKLAKAGYSHGDPHTRNIMTVKLEDGSNKLYLIDYERATSITNLKFQILSDRDLQTIELQFPYIVELYRETLSKLTEMVGTSIPYETNSELQNAVNTVIVEYINGLLQDRDEYIRAVLVIAMCRSDIYDSILYWTTHKVVMPENVGGDKVRRFHGYDYLFNDLTIDLIDRYYTRIRELSIRELSKRKQAEDFDKTPSKSIKQGGLRKYKTNNNSIRFKKKHRKKHTKKHRRKHTKKHRKKYTKSKKIIMKAR